MVYFSQTLKFLNSHKDQSMKLYQGIQTRHTFDLDNYQAQGPNQLDSN